MLKRHNFILFILAFIAISNSFGQIILDDNMLSDSLIKKHKIKQVTENWFHDSITTSPENTTIEKYNEIGQRTQRITINYFYHKYIDDYTYNLKKYIVTKTQYYYDWNPYREKKRGDTIVEKTVLKYDISTRRNLKIKPNILDKFQPRFTFDNFGRIAERIDTVKCGYISSFYTYDENGRVIERKYYELHHSENPYLFAIDSLHYNNSGQLIKQVNLEIRMNGDKWDVEREVIETYIYNEKKLLSEKTRSHRYLLLQDSEHIPTVFRYSYEFY